MYLKRLLVSFIMFTSVVTVTSCGPSEVELAYELVQEQVHKDIGPSFDLPCCAADFVEEDLGQAEIITFFYIPVTHNGLDFLIEAQVIHYHLEEAEVSIRYTDGRGHEVDIPK